MRPWWRGDPRPDGDLGLLHDAARAAALASPPPPGPWRRGDLIGLDAISTWWEAVDRRDGTPGRLRTLHPRYARDEALRQRFFAPVAAGPAPADQGASRFYPTPGWPLSQLDPREDGVDSVLLARILAAALRATDAIHAAGRGLGGGLAERLFVNGDAIALLDADPFAAPWDPPADLADLGAQLAALDPDGADPIAQLGATLASAPPPSAAIAQGLLRATLAEQTVHAHHRLAFAARRSQGQRDQLALLAAVEALSCPPPPLRAALRCGPETIWVSSSPAAIHGGPGPSPAATPLVWSPDQGLDPVAARALARAWATRHSGDEARRAALQAECGADDAQVPLLLRWLSATARLRAARLLLRRSLPR